MEPRSFSCFSNLAAFQVAICRALAGGILAFHFKFQFAMRHESGEGVRPRPENDWRVIRRDLSRGAR
jgi:hypothetical protein